MIKLTKKDIEKIINDRINNLENELLYITCAYQKIIYNQFIYNLKCIIFIKDSKLKKIEYYKHSKLFHEKLFEYYS